MIALKNQLLRDTQVLLIRLSIALILYPISKIIFFFFNSSYFTDVSLLEFLFILFWGLRFDISALVLINTPFILLHIIPFLKKAKWYQLTLKVLFITLNSIAILADCIDLTYYRFTLKRMTSDFFDLFRLGSDISTMLPRYIADFWYVIIIWIGITIFIGWLYGKTQRITPTLKGDKDSIDLKKIETSSIKSPSRGLGQIAVWLILNSVLIGLCIVAFRGGLQLRPIMPINASEYVSAKNIPLVINTAFSIIKSYGLEQLEEKKYFSEEGLKKIYDPIHKSGGSNALAAKNNVFLIILESFSKEYIGALTGGKTYTPFLDSLMSESLVFTNAFANGKKSIEGIPAILAGLPALTNESYITSSYGSNRFTSIANALKTKKYSSAFFHGGTNGTMGFDAFCNAAGFDNYYGRTEYNNEKDYDGDWGIWDEEFFQYTSKTVSQMNEPFFASLFSLSSHHPSAIPKKYKSRFTEGDLPILKSVQYADLALRNFFRSASKEKWFDNTLFIITADHTGPSNDSYYNNSTGIFQIPILLYKHNSSFKGIKDKIVQQIDILPTTLNYLNYPKDYFAFGNDMLDTLNEGYAVNFINDVYQLFQGEYLLQFDGHTAIGFYNYKTDLHLQRNLIGTQQEIETQMEKKLKAIIQNYYHGMIHNQLTAP